MSFIVEGRLQYIRYVGTPRREVKQAVDHNEDWISEPVLWSSRWLHRGDLLAIRHCELLSLNARQFPEILKRSPQVYVFVCRYASNYIKWINSLDRDLLTDITKGDLCSDAIKALMLGTVPTDSAVSLRQFASREKSFRGRMTRWKGLFSRD